MKKLAPFLILFLITVFFYSCGKKEEATPTPGQEAAYSSDKDADIQRYNLKVKEEQAGSRNPCDTLSLLAYVLENYPKGTYVVNFDKTLAFNVPKPAVIY